MKYASPARKIFFVAGGLFAILTGTAEAACIDSFKGCVDGSIIAYAACRDGMDWGEGPCTKTIEEFKQDCMNKYPECADRAYVEDHFADFLRRNSR